METTTLNIGGADVTVETKALFRAFLEKHLGIPQHPSAQPAPPAPNEGERYVGTIVRADGTGHHIYRLPIEHGKKLSWAKAMEYAKEQGAELPDRVEGALLFATKEDCEFEAEWYWTREQHAGYDACAWCQYFLDGHQDYSPKGYDFRVVLVRRVAI